MELFFLAILFVLMMYALGSGFPVAFALSGSAIVTIADPGKAKATGKPEPSAYIIKTNNIARKNSSIMLPPLSGCLLQMKLQLDPPES